MSGLGESRLKIVGLFDNLINQIDLKAESLIASLRGVQFDRLYEIIVAKRELFVNELKKLQEYNLKLLSRDEKSLFKKFCFIMDENDLDSIVRTIDSPFLGYLVILDCPLSPESLTYYKSFLKERRINLTDWFDQYETGRGANVDLRQLDIIFNSKQSIYYTSGSDLFGMDEVAVRNVLIYKIKPQAEFMFRYVQSLHLVYNQMDVLLASQVLQTINQIRSSQTHLKLIDCSIHIDEQCQSDAIRTISLQSCRLTGSIRLVSLINLVKLRLDQVNLNTSIPLFSGLKSLEELYYERNELTSIYQNTFNGLFRLKVLSLQQNRISHIDAGSFSTLQSLQVLRLGCNRIRSIERDTFKGLTSLEELRLHHNELSRLDEQVFDEIKQVQVLDLSYNFIRSVNTHTFASLTSLRELCLERNQLVDKIDQSYFDSLKTSSKKFRLISE